MGSREPGSKGKDVPDRDKPSDPKEAKISQQANEIATLKQQLRASEPPKPVLKVEYETFDSEEAALYVKVGARCVSITKRYPNQPMSASRKYGFAETKEELQGLIGQAKESGRIG